MKFPFASLTLVGVYILRVISVTSTFHVLTHYTEYLVHVIGTFYVRNASVFKPNMSGKRHLLQRSIWISCYCLDINTDTTEVKKRLRREEELHSSDSMEGASPSPQVSPAPASELTLCLKASRNIKLWWEFGLPTSKWDLEFFHNDNWSTDSGDQLSWGKIAVQEKKFNGIPSSLDLPPLPKFILKSPGILQARAGNSIGSVQQKSIQAVEELGSLFCHKLSKASGNGMWWRLTDDDVSQGC